MSTAETWEPVGTTLLASMHLLGLNDDAEGFRILVQERNQPWFVYGIYCSPVFYQRNRALPGNAYQDSLPPPHNPGNNLLFRVQNSSLLQHLRATADIEVLAPFELSHYAVCLVHEERIDIVCKGEVIVRLAGAGDIA